MRKHFYKSPASAEGSVSNSNNESSSNDHTPLDEIDEEKRVLRLPTRRRLVFGGCSTNCPNETTEAAKAERCSNRKRWNSFHSTRREYHPNRIKKERKSIAAIVDTTPGTRRATKPMPMASLDDIFLSNPTNRALIDKSNYMSSPSKSWMFRRGRSLVDDSNRIDSTALAFIDDNVDELTGGG
jgi:hypothetical protein